MVAVFGALPGPTADELYFRGYLLPRMSFAGWWAPLLHSTVRAVPFLDAPWKFLARTLGMLPLVYDVRWRNMNLAIIVHVLANFLDVATAIAIIARMSSSA